MRSKTSRKYVRLIPWGILAVSVFIMLNSLFGGVIGFSITALLMLEFLTRGRVYSQLSPKRFTALFKRFTIHKRSYDRDRLADEPTQIKRSHPRPSVGAIEVAEELTQIGHPSKQTGRSKPAKIEPAKIGPAKIGPAKIEPALLPSPQFSTPEPSPEDLTQVKQIQSRKQATPQSPHNPSTPKTSPDSLALPNAMSLSASIQAQQPSKPEQANRVESTQEQSAKERTLSRLSQQQSHNLASEELTRIWHNSPENRPEEQPEECVEEEMTSLHHDYSSEAPEPSLAEIPESSATAGTLVYDYAHFLESQSLGYQPPKAQSLQPESLETQQLETTTFNSSQPNHSEKEMSQIEQTQSVETPVTETSITDTSITDTSITDTSTIKTSVAETSITEDLTVLGFDNLPKTVDASTQIRNLPIRKDIQVVDEPTQIGHTHIRKANQSEDKSTQIGNVRIRKDNQSVDEPTQIKNVPTPKNIKTVDKPTQIGHVHAPKGIETADEPTQIGNVQIRKTNLAAEPTQIASKAKFDTAAQQTKIFPGQAPHLSTTQIQTKVQIPASDLTLAEEATQIGQPQKPQSKNQTTQIGGNQSHRIDPEDDHTTF
jgi:hypothetical protein